MTSSPAPRTAGLDTLRATAIALVFLYHHVCFVSDQPALGGLGDVGWVGVDLFFVLSGYLIANQLFKGMANGRTVSTGRFYLRRAFRTLPVSWVIPGGYWPFPAQAGGHPPPPLWRFLTFTQNLGLQPGTAFSHAWSLCVEEQFYVAFPLVLAAGAALAASIPRADARRFGWLLLGTMVVVGIASRAALWSVYGRKADGQVDGYMTAIYDATRCRFDEFVPGIAIALLRNFDPLAWGRMMARGSRRRPARALVVFDLPLAPAGRQRPRRGAEAAGAAGDRPVRPRRDRLRRDRRAALPDHRGAVHGAPRSLDPDELCAGADRSRRRFARHRRARVVSWHLDQRSSVVRRADFIDTDASRDRTRRSSIDGRARGRQQRGDPMSALLPFWLLIAPAVLLFIDSLRTGSGTSAMTSGAGAVRH